MNSFASPQTLVTLPFSPLADDLYARVLDAILDRRIEATSRFTEESLAQLFSVRRSDIRGVLTQLAHQQVILQRANHRPRVASLDVEQTRQALHARRLTETTLVRLVCQQPRPQALKCLRQLIDRERQCVARGSAIRLAGTFHLQLAEMARNAPLAHFLGSLVPLTSLAIAQFDTPLEGYCDGLAHEQIVQAVEHGDALKAESLLSRQLDHLEATLLNHPLSRVAG
ncbi:MAG: GntR family transcriptional regulator [Pseudomonas sp.]|nr:GntR family transcriptional regulator [Pseudomonas sp.]